MAGSPFQIGPTTGQANMYKSGAAATSPAGTAGIGAAAGVTGHTRGATGGGVPDLGAGRSAIVPARAPDRFLGINTQAMPETLGLLETPNAVNVDGIRRPGAIQPRLGIVKTENATANTIGIGLVNLYFNVSGSQQGLLVSETTASAASLQATGIVCGVPPIRAIVPATSMTVTASGSWNFTVAVGTALQTGGIEAVGVAWNLGGPFPTSPSVDASRGSDNYTEYAWYGDTSFSQAIASGTTTVGTRVYVTVWIITRLGRSAPLSGSVVVTA